MSINNLASWSRDVLETHINDGLDQVEVRLTQTLEESRGLVDDLVQHLSRAGGKRMRPGLVLLCAHLGTEGADKNGVVEDVLRAAIVVELTHLATLYHDDVMDSAPTRRGVPSAQKVWGNNRAVLAGDLVFSRASQEVAELGPAAVKQHAHTFERLCRGQINESFGPAEGEDPVAFYLQVLADKTGSLVAQSARFGAEISGADLNIADQVSTFGERVGVAFQIADDVIDLESDREVSGKTPGTDLREGVTTLPTLLLEKQERECTIDEAGSTILSRWRSETDLQDDKLLADTVQLMRQHPVLEETRQAAFSWAEQAKDSIRDLPSDSVREALYEFADLLVDRIS